VFYVFCYDDDIWKSICFGIRTLTPVDGSSCSVEEFPSPLPRFERTWRDSYVRWKMQERWGGHSNPIPTPGLCSGSPFNAAGNDPALDVLYHTWLGAAAHIEQWALSRETVDRVHVRELTVEQFRERYELPRRPVVMLCSACALTRAGHHWWSQHGLGRWACLMDTRVACTNARRSCVWNATRPRAHLGERVTYSSSC
jgi:hypothetical protein